MALFGSIATVRAQAPATPVFASAWAYVAQLMEPGSVVHRRMLALAAGASEKHELVQGVVAIEQAYETRLRADTFFETHRKYIDIQIVVSGEEIMEVLDVARASVREPYQEQRDLIMYHDTPLASLLRVRAGDATVFFPVDVHMGGLRTEPNPVLVRKSVLKVPVSG